MPRRDASSPRRGVWRPLAVLLAAALGVAAIVLVVFSTTAKQTQIGVLLGAWAVFVAAPVFFGSRRNAQSDQLRDMQAHSERLHEAQLEISRLQQAQIEAAKDTAKSQEVELRRFGELQLARETASRREADFRLEIALRGEIERVLTEQIGALRDEVAALRAEVVDKLGGQLRLERIETTRVIASDLEALQSEIRRLGGSRESLAAAAERPPAPARGGERHDTRDAREDDILDAEVVETERYPVVHSEPARDQAPADAPSAPPAAPPAAPAAAAAAPPPEPLAAAAPPAPMPAAAAPAPEPVAAPAPTAPAAAAAARQPEPTASTADLFAGLPRLTPMPREFADLLTPDDVASAAPATATPASATPATAAPSAPPSASAASSADGADDPRYVGRRRAAGDASGDQEPSPPKREGGRRRAPDDAPDDLLARLHRS